MRALAVLAAVSWVRTRRQAALGVLVCLVVPLTSWAVDGRGRFAFTMYASTVTYRLAIAQIDEGGARRTLDPARVAEDVSSSAAPFLAGADGYRTVAQIDALRDHLRDVARAACRSRRGSTIEITLHERSAPRASESPDDDAAAAQTTERVACPRSE
jgi:hypothetical protein